MSIKRMSAVWELSQHRGNELLLLLAIADFADDLGVAWPSYETLAGKTRGSARNTIRLAGSCNASGELWTLNRPRQQSNVHIVTVGLNGEQLTAAAQKAADLGALDPTGSDSLSPPTQVLVVTGCHNPGDSLSEGYDTGVTRVMTQVSHDPSLIPQDPQEDKNRVLSSLWSQTLDLLAGSMTQATFDVQLRGSRVVSRDNGTLTIDVESCYRREWCQHRLRPVVERVARVVFNAPDLEVAFVGDEE